MTQGIVDDGEFKLNRVLIANRGELARRLIRHYKKCGVETVAVFCEPEAEDPYLDEADYATYLNGDTVAATYMDSARIVGAAIDAACDAIHPGYCFLAERAEFFARALSANVAVIGAAAETIARVVDRGRLFRIAKDLEIPLIPSTPTLEDDSDGIEAGVALGLPLFVKAVHGGALHRVGQWESLPEAVRGTRELARFATGVSEIYLESAVDIHRHIGTIIVADRHGGCVYLGHLDGSLQVNYRTWVEEAGPHVAGNLDETLGIAAVKLARAVEWVGVGCVRWAVTKHGDFYLLGFSGRLTTGYSLVEAVTDIDLIELQDKMVIRSEHLAFMQSSLAVKRCGIQTRVLHVDPGTLSRPDGKLTELDVSGDMLVEMGGAAGQQCTEETEPLLTKITVTAPTRTAAIVQASAAINDLRVSGPPTNVEVLRAVFRDPDYWKGDWGVSTLSEFLP